MSHFLKSELFYKILMDIKLNSYVQELCTLNFLKELNKDRMNKSFTQFIITKFIPLGKKTTKHFIQHIHKKSTFSSITHQMKKEHLVLQS